MGRILLDRNGDEGGDLRGEMVTSQRRSELKKDVEKPWGLAGRHECQEWPPSKASCDGFCTQFYQAVACSHKPLLTAGGMASE